MYNKYNYQYFLIIYLNFAGGESTGINRNRSSIRQDDAAVTIQKGNIDKPEETNVEESVSDVDYIDEGDMSDVDRELDNLHFLPRDGPISG